MYNVGDIAWRLQLGSAFIPAVPLIIGVYFAPESPRWLIKKGRYQKTYRPLLRLRNSPLQAARDLYYIHAQIEAENVMIQVQEVAKIDNIVTRFIKLFTTPRIRRATQASGIIMTAQQICGSKYFTFAFLAFFQADSASQHHCVLLVDHL